MPEVTITTTVELGQELNEMAQTLGYTNAKEMVIRFLRKQIITQRRADAQDEVEQAVEEAGQREVEGIS